MWRILYIEQQDQLLNQLAISLHFEDIELEHIRDGMEVGTIFQASKWDLVVIGEPDRGVSAIQVLIELRALDLMIPIISIVQSGKAQERIRMFRLGASDVLSQPVHMDELIERIMKLLHYYSGQNVIGGYIEVGDLYIDTINRRVTRDDKEIQLTPTEHDLLTYLARAEGKVHSRQDILNKVWGYEFHGQTNIVDVYIRYLRIKIDKGHRKKLIKTVHGIGYMISV